jgi:hypothetical protein
MTRRPVEVKSEIPRVANRYKPSDCPLCEYDRRARPFPRPSVRDENRMIVTRDVRASFNLSVRRD